MVNSFDEWSPLKEVIVGSPINYTLHDLELSFKLFFHDNRFPAVASYYPSYATNVERPPAANERRPSTQQLKAQYLEELTEDVAGLVSTLERLGVTVHRPLTLNRVIKFKTPYWESTCIPALNIRDQAMILGDEIIETPPQIRARYFENDLLKPIFYRYFRAGARWTTMPKPVMTDYSFDLSYVEAAGREMIATEAIPLYEQKASDLDVGHEMMIDAAQCIRFGKDLLVNVATENHELGLQWLQRHVGDRFRVHRVYRMTDNHIDSIVLPLRPGTLLLRAPRFRELLPEPLQKWDVIYPPDPTENIFPTYEVDDMILTSKYIDLNVFSVDEEKVIVNALFPELSRTLERHGFTPIPVRHRHRRLFGGGFHCFTLDTVREGGLEDYFG
jgi:glycine amidinotransferase